MVPVVKSATDGQVYVLDPAIEPSQPLPWQAWLLRMVPALESVEVVVADPNAYVPESLVTGGANERDQALLAMEGWFLRLEWNRQIELARDPWTVLGESPPWRRTRYYVIADDEFFAVIPSCLTCNSDNQALTARCAAHCP